MPIDQRTECLEPTQSGAPPLVGVVDDDVSLLRALQRLLRADGFGVSTFSSAEEFLGSPGRCAVACLVLDVHLGGMNGFELQERLAASGSRVPVLFITARDDASTQERARQAGAVDYLRKPFDDMVLLAAVHKALGRA